jgi:steroid 5-alpha reductase family enzyme
MENIVNAVPIFIINICAIMLLMLTGWLISLAVKNAALADRIWGLGFILVAWVTFIQVGHDAAKTMMIPALTTIWGLRLFIHISWRSRGKGEDPRYGAMRKKHGKAFWIISLFKVFIVQGLFMWTISFVVQYGQAARYDAAINAFDIAGMLIWTVGLFFESVSDWQLARFISNHENRGKIMNRGLWKYSRHPNYFGESCIWWGMFIIVLQAPGGIVTIISPLLITYTLLRVSGVTLMERTIFGDNPDYKKYVESTSSFIPWLPKKPG